MLNNTIYVNLKYQEKSMSSIEATIIVPIIIILLCLSLCVFAEITYEGLLYIAQDTAVVAKKNNIETQSTDDVKVLNLVLAERYKKETKGTIKTPLHEVMSKDGRDISFESTAIKYNFRLILTGQTLLKEVRDEIKSW